MILIGLTVEISLFFAINGVVFAKLLPPDRTRAHPRASPTAGRCRSALSLVSVGVELLLHADGVFHWYYWWWNVASFPVIVVFGYLTFYVVAFTVFYMPRRTRQLQLVGAPGARSTWLRASCSGRCSAGSEQRATRARAPAPEPGARPRQLVRGDHAVDQPVLASACSAVK